MSEHREEHLDLCAGYALGSLTEADRRRLDEHLAGGCPICESALADFSAATVLLASSLPAATPRPELRTRVLGALGEASQERESSAPRAPAVAARPTEPPARATVVEMRPRPAMSWIGWSALAAAAALAVVSGLSWNTANQLRQQLAATRAQIDGAQSQVAQLTQQLADEQRWAAVMNAPDAKVAALALTPQGLAQLKARAIYDPATRKAVIVFDNFTPPPGKDYELWALEGAGVTSLGVIKADAGGRAVLRLDNVGDPATLGGFAVSLENQGGAGNPHQPGGPVVMAGKFGV